MSECIICKKEFISKRSDAKFCSSGCRQRATRNPELLRSKINIAEKEKEIKKVLPSQKKDKIVIPDEGLGNTICGISKLSKYDLERRKKKCGF